MQLKPQDTLLALKHWSVKYSLRPLSLREMAESIGVSASEASKGSKRLIASGLLVERDARQFVEKGSLIEWLSYGVRYAYPAQKEGYGRGLATSWSCKLTQSEMLAPSPALVWENAGGDAEGIFVKPIHASVPKAAGKDEFLYQALALVDAIRLGKPRELEIARELLGKLIRA